MLTSPVNVTIAIANGAALKPHAAPNDAGANKQVPLLPANQGHPAEMMIEPELPSNSLMTHVNAVAATAGSRTILQELSLNVAIMLKLARRQDETLTSLFIRIIAAIEAMPQAERLQFEVRSGLKAQKITLADLAAALRKPDGSEAARLTAIAEAPSAVPGRAAATAATATYLQEGTADGHAEETLAMRAAARSSAAGQNVFTAEAKVRPADSQPADARILQDQLKSMFEPGDALGRDTELEQDVQELPLPEDVGAAADEDDHGIKRDTPSPEPRLARPLPSGSSATITISTANLKLDPQALEKIRSMAQEIASKTSETVRVDPERPAPEKSEGADRRVQTMLTLKGLVEVVSALPAKTAEILAAPPIEVEVPLPETAAEDIHLPAGAPRAAFDREDILEFTEASDMAVSDDAVELATAEGIPAETWAETQAETQAETLAEDAIPRSDRQEAQAGTAAAEDAPPQALDHPPLARADLAQHGVPFAYAQVQPAREEMIEAVAEEEGREETDEDAKDENDDGDEPRRPRDEYDAIHDPLAEEEPSIVINRDSSEADRAFALYQRMGGF